MNDSHRPLIENTRTARVLLVALTAGLTAGIAWATSVLLDMRADYQGIKSSLEQVYDWEKELETDASNLRRDMEGLHYRFRESLDTEVDRLRDWARSLENQIEANDARVERRLDDLYQRLAGSCPDNGSDQRAGDQSSDAPDDRVGADDDCRPVPGSGGDVGVNE